MAPNTPRRTLDWKVAIAGGVALGAGFGVANLAGANEPRLVPGLIELDRNAQVVSAGSLQPPLSVSDTIDVDRSTFDSTPSALSPSARALSAPSSARIDRIGSADSVASIGSADSVASIDSAPSVPSSFSLASLESVSVASPASPPSAASADSDGPRQRPARVQQGGGQDRPAQPPRVAAADSAPSPASPASYASPASPASGWSADS